ncbi:hypothetical protein CTI12_AA069160 [Artemisia annua]|uniref:Protein kinase domain-containing protein n=1 Tax=Artemisia annua TaxID=35608 RepID=A0A2U1Q6N3_ARTAN|nr:hypothetical protein CTI12_AA069160 [Artemisia annua]
MNIVKAIQDLYRSFNTPPQLKGWKLTDGDPCQESWTGVSCVGSSIIQIKIDNLNISGNLGYQLENFHHLKLLDVSNNSIYGEIPYGLPSNLTHLNLSHNQLSGPVGNVFTGLSSLKEMDLSYNQFIGDLPSSFEMLKSLSRLFLQNNEFTGSVIFLASLQLTDLNIQDNHFSGIIPKQFQHIHNLWFGGNMFDKGNNGPPFDNPSDLQNITTPPSTESSAFKSYPFSISSKHKKKAFGKSGILIGVGALVVACLLLFAMIRFRKCGRKCRRSKSSEVEWDRRNLKAANVLLDEDLTPRICDCCLAVLKPLTINSARAEASEADNGGIAPEYIQPVSGNQKDDIYAFGVLLLELLTGKKSSDELEPREENSLVNWASSRLHDNESLDEMVEPAIRKTIPAKALSRFADIVSLCTQTIKLDDQQYLGEAICMWGKDDEDNDVEDLVRSFSGLEEKVLGQYTMAKANNVRTAVVNYLLDAGVQWGGAPAVKGLRDASVELLHTLVAVHAEVSAGCKPLLDNIF